MLQQELVGEFAGVQDDIEVDARIGKGMEAYSRVRTQLRLDALHDLFCDLKGHTLHLVEIAVVAHADRYADGQLLGRHAVVREDGRSDFLIRNYDDVSGAGENCRKALGDIRYAALFAGTQPDVVADAQLLGQYEMKPGENIGEGFLQTEGHGHTTNAESRDDRGN